MAITCAHCSRVNPAEAAYCYHDGSALRSGGGPRNIGAQEFPAAFVFPSGRTCRTFDQLALACQNDWAAAVALLSAGHFERFLGTIGRIDLVMAARSAAEFPDADRGLDQFLARLPTQALAPPRLEVVGSTDIDLGTLRADADHRFEIRVRNKGMRLLYGSVVSDCKWLALGEDRGVAQKLFQTSDDLVLPVTVRSRYLRAGNKGLKGRLVLESNGGNVTVTIRVIVPSVPFTQGSLAGALTPRQLAEKARAAPKEAAPFFESGAIRKWYEANGWAYPIQGPNAAGLGAVQQFFEALGLAKPPRVELSEQALSLRGKPGEALRPTLQVRALEKRPVFATAASDQPWLVVGPVHAIGSVATIPLQIDPVPNQAGKVLQARLSVTANGGQHFVVPVSLTVGAGTAIRAAAAAIPTIAVIDTAIAAEPLRKAKPHAPVPPRALKRKRATPDEPPDGDASRRALLVVGGLLLLLLLAGGVVAILLMSGSGGTVQVAVDDEPPEEKKGPKGNGLAVVPVVKVDIQDEPEEATKAAPLPFKHHVQDEPEERLKEAPPQPVKVEIKDEAEEVEPGARMGKGGSGPVDPEPRVTYRYGPNMRFGILALKDTFGRPLNKRITFSGDGATSNTRIKVNGQDGEYGEPSGRWLVRAQPVPNDPVRQSRNGTLSVLALGKVRISQIVEIVPSKQPVTVAPGTQRRLLDTVLCRYQIENLEKRTHTIGLRVQVDTLIGNNDGVPFTVPGYAGLVNTMADFRTSKQVPEFIQALEVPNLQNPGTVANMTLKPGGGLEPPARVSLTHWAGGGAPWEVSVQHMGGDSAVVIYWPEKVLQPGQKRQFGYAYGLGRVDAGEGGGRLGITLGGSFEPGQVFTVTAYVNNPVPNQTLTLDVPQGLQIQNPATVVVPPAQGAPPTSVVTWNTKVLQTGEFRIKVRSSTGVSQSKTITIARPEGPTGGKLAMELLAASFEPGQTFTVVGSVTAPVPNQTLTLNLPKGLERVEGPETAPVPPPPDGNKDGTSTLRWKVRVLEPGKFPVRLISSTGVARTKTLTILRPGENGGRFALTLGGDFAPGKIFSVTAVVTEPVAGQKLTLRLPARLQLADGAETQLVPPAPEKGGIASVTWKVKVPQPGKFPLRVESSTGVVQKKTITIEQADTNDGRFTLELSGAIAPGKEFVVTGKVTNPVSGQKLTLTLPRALLLVEGAQTQAVPRGTSEVQWTVRVLERGRLPVRVESSTGVARTKTITITEVQNPQGELFGR